ncbi:MAG: hypothetical protein Q9P01_03430 [Anaerolineae bacterium]|nr:hypothetical protein [Anaerolineae bacterium]
MSLYRIDAAKWFNAAVDACLFVVAIGTLSSDYTLKVYQDFESHTPDSTINFHDGRLISDWATFQRLSHFYGQSQIEWRQGVKHDAASVLELAQTELGWMSKRGEIADVEAEYCYPLLKSSDVRPDKMTNIDKAVILPQRKLGENTALLEQQAPRLWAYLKHHQSVFQQRKSSIYRNKSEFAIFGVGDYTFAPYKVLVSGFYKEPFFLPVSHFEDKPIVCDDTVYMLPCDSLMQAILIATLLNHQDAQAFIQSIAFSDSKRPITKSLLQMIDLEALLYHLPLNDIHAAILNWGRLLHLDDNQVLISHNLSDYRHLISEKQYQLPLF